MAVYTPAEFVGKLAELQVAVGAVPRTGIKPAAALVATSIATTAPKRLRGVGRGGASLGTRIFVVAEGDAEVRPVGPWALLEHDTRPHQIPRSSAQGRRYAVFGGNVYSVVHHPGTHGQHVWERASLAAAPAVEKFFGTENDLALRRVFP